MEFPVGKSSFAETVLHCPAGFAAEEGYTGGERGIDFWQDAAAGGMGMRKNVPVQITVCFPGTERGLQALAKRMAALHVDAAGRQAGGGDGKEHGGEADAQE